jgi:hypothetical protein
MNPYLERVTRAFENKQTNVRAGRSNVRNDAHGH